MLQKTCLFCLTKIYGVRFTLWILTTTYKLYTKRDPHNARMRSRYALGRSKILSSFSPFVDRSSQNKVGMCRRRLFFHSTISCVFLEIFAISLRSCPNGRLLSGNGPKFLTQSGQFYIKIRVAIEHVSKFW